MKGIKLFLQLQSLSKNELKLLQKAVNSPYFNSNPSVTLLFEKLKRQHPNFDESPKGRRNLYKKMFPSEDYQDAKLRRLFTFLSEVVEKFMIQQELENNPQTQQRLLIDVYEKRNLTSLFEQEINCILETEATPDLPYAQWYLEQYQLLVQKYSSLAHQKYNIKDNTLDLAVHCLDNYFALEKIQMVISQKNREKILNRVPDYGFLPLPSPTTITDNPLFELYHQSYQLLLNSKDVDFNNYDILLQKRMPYLSDGDKIILFYNGLNYLVRQANAGDYSNDEFTLKWYKWGINRAIFYSKWTDKCRNIWKYCHQCLCLPRF